ncbi:hypothetical protein Csal_1663 [Chromohalobacter israelensis DSM 3043]|uniref:DUF3613 domain-containing protein n=2 Tax=Chromohalobacter israelensis TaxID=141390 RepID=Q1QWZ2_CHRI1|nr:hypothetical protein Csal_1663 [Chromohalobacter salexigens DSM 3043]
MTATPPGIQRPDIQRPSTQPPGIPSLSMPRSAVRRAGLALVLLVGLGAGASAVQAQQGEAARGEAMQGRGTDQTAGGASGLSASPGQATRRLLEWQRSGRGASSHRQELAGPVQTAIWERYVESFRQAIPDRYIDTDDYGSQ